VEKDQEETTSNRPSYEKEKGVKVLSLGTRVLEANEHIAAENRRELSQKGTYVINLISSPGSGKTTFLVETLKALNETIACAVIEGDQHTDHDAQRISSTGVSTVQINTLSSCHLEAFQVRRAMGEMDLSRIELLFIENIGNLVCPAEYDLGENEKIVLMSITEGEDKPVKYPLAFHLATAIVITKMDLLPYLRFDLELCHQYIKKVNPSAPIFHVSSYELQGFEDWLSWLKRKAIRKIS